MDLTQIQDGDVIEPGEWKNQEEQQFNHQILVMGAMKKCLEAGSTELREGWWEEKMDKQGNIRKTYHEDTRKIFIESVKSLLMIMSCDINKKTSPGVEDEINKLLLYIKERKQFWLDEEWNWWINLNTMQQQMMTREGKNVMKGFFNSKLNFDNNFFYEEVEAWREIFILLNKVTYDLDFYGSLAYGA